MLASFNIIEGGGLVAQVQQSRVINVLWPYVCSAVYKMYEKFSVSKTFK